MRNNFLIILILAVSFLKWFTWVALVPFFQMPDEPAHFCYVQKLAENHKIYLKKGDTYFTEEVTSAWRDGKQEDIAFSRVNKYDFIDGQFSEYEKKLNNLPFESRKKLVDIPFVPVQYPPLYYLASTLAYNIFYFNNIFARDFSVRIFSVVLGLITVFTVYKIAKLIFPQKKYISEAIALLVSFNPMFTFISSSINSDCLLNALFTLFIYFYIKISTNKYNIRDIISISIVIILGFFTKQLFILSLVIMGISLLLFLKVSGKTKIILISSLAMMVIISVSYLVYNFPVPVIGSSATGFIKYVFSNLVPFLYFDFVNSFFGNFGWLDTPIPPIFSNIFFIMFISFVLLFVVDFIRSIKDKKTILTAKQYLILIVPLVVYSFSVIYVESNTHFGLQGRYFFPVISIIYICLFCGFISLIPGKIRLRYIFVLVILTVIFNAYCLFGVIVPRYYL